MVHDIRTRNIMNHYIKSLMQVYRCRACFVSDPKLLSSFSIVTILLWNQKIKFNQVDDVQHQWRNQTKKRIQFILNIFILKPNTFNNDNDYCWNAILWIKVILIWIQYQNIYKTNDLHNWIQKILNCNLLKVIW